MVSRLYELGCKAKIYAPPHTRDYLSIAMEDSLKIMESDIRYLSNKLGKKVRPMFSVQSVNRMLNSIVEVDFNNLHTINDFMSINFKHAYHILNSAQLELFVKDGNYNKKIYYSSDLGNISLRGKHFLEPFEKVNKADIAIVETTYAMKKKKSNQKTRDKDIEKLQTAIRETCLENKGGNLVIASFAMQRAQEVLLLLYNLYGESEDFKTRIIVDSPLSVKVTKHFIKASNEVDSNKLQQAIDWENVELIDDWKVSESIRSSGDSKIIISASGFGEAGRIRDWIKHDLPNESSMFVFVGYSSPESTSGQIKIGKKKYLDIDGIRVKNKAKVVNLLSFTSHIQHNDMLEYYSDLNVREIYLVHGDMENRIEFAQLLEDEYRKKNKTTKVYIGSKGVEVFL